MFKERLYHRNVKGPGGLVPGEFVLGLGAWPFTPENPGGKDSVEKRLDERRTKEILALLPGEGEPQCLLKGGTEGSKTGQASVRFNPGLGIARIGCKEPGDLLGGRQRRLLEPHQELVQRH